MSFWPNNHVFFGASNLFKNKELTTIGCEHTLEVEKGCHLKELGVWTLSWTQTQLEIVINLTLPKCFRRGFLIEYFWQHRNKACLCCTYHQELLTLPLLRVKSHQLSTQIGDFLALGLPLCLLGWDDVNFFPTNLYGMMSGLDKNLNCQLNMEQSFAFCLCW